MSKAIAAPISAQMAKFAAELRYEDLPADGRVLSIVRSGTYE